MRYAVIGLLVVLITLSGNLAHAITDEERDSLHGLPGVYVDIHAPSKEAQQDGLSKEAIQTAVELILRSSGIKILTTDKPVESIPPASLTVRLGTVKGPNLYSYCVEVNLAQEVALSRQPGHTMIATTWRKGIGGMIGQEMLVSVIGNAIEPAIKDFANDFLTVNPR